MDCLHKTDYLWELLEYFNLKILHLSQMETNRTYVQMWFVYKHNDFFKVSKP